jgi:ABC-type lipoprotein release transport system permease subunit
VTPLDPLSYAAAAALLGAATLAASWLPARRAARLDPSVVLRCE